MDVKKGAAFAPAGGMEMQGNICGTVGPNKAEIRG
jgi:hypothetical protein